MRCWHPETYLRLRRVNESKSRKSTYGKSRDTTKVEEYRKYKKKNEVSRQNKVLNILNIQTGKMILWHASGQELNLLSEKRNLKKTQNLCMKRWYLWLCKMVERWKGSATAAEEEESVEATNLHLMNLPEIKRYMLKMRMLYKKNWRCKLYSFWQ